MRKNLAIALALVAGLAFGAAALAGEHGKSVTIEGSMMCAHCTLKEAGVTSCQDVVVAKGEGGKSVNYYLTSNETLKKFGHACNGAKDVKVTGTVTEKDGKMWIEPVSIEAKKA